jgi:hypothetical protein
MLGFATPANNRQGIKNMDINNSTSILGINTPLKLKLEIKTEMFSALRKNNFVES